MPNRPPITNFAGANRFLSNFYGGEPGLDWGRAIIEMHEIRFWCNEVGFQAEKACHKSESDFFRVSQIRDAREAKRAGKPWNLPLTPAQLAVWESEKESVMLDLNRAKFRQHDYLAERLYSTGDALLVEGNFWHDQIWGSCVCPKHKEIPGENKLGLILMYVREEMDNG